MRNRRIVHKKVVVQGHGIQDVIKEYTRNGVRYMRYQSLNGVKRLVPIVLHASANLTHKGIDQLSAIAHASPSTTSLLKDGSSRAIAGLSDLVEHNNATKMGGRVKPARNLILREIHHALRK